MGSPLFINFCAHVFFVSVRLPIAREVVTSRKIPLKYHASCVTLGFLFTTFKSNASVRLPQSLCLVLMNLQMLVGMVVERLAFGRRYSVQQVIGCTLVTAGIILAGFGATS